MTGFVITKDGGINIDNIKCILSDYVDIRLGSKNMKYYKELGYEGKFGDVIHVKVDDIKPTSHIKIETQCPMCKKNHDVQYCDYYKRQHTLCNPCSSTYFNTKNNVCVYCGKKATRLFDGRYYCDKHAEHMKKYGKCIDVTCRDLNEIHYEEDYAVLHIRNGEQIDVALVKIDLEAVDYVNDIHWSYSRTDGFVVSKNNVKLHRYLYQKLIGEIECNHILFRNNDMYDMRSSNLVQTNEKSIRIFSDDDNDIEGIFVKNNLKVGVIDDKHYKLLNVRELKDIDNHKKPIVVEVNENGCWNCISHSQHPDGYVYVHSDGDKIKLHKRVLEMKIGRKLKVDCDELTRHTCDNPQCCNPDHLIIGTHQENYDDMVARGRGYWQNYTGYFKWYEREGRRNKHPKPLLPEETIINIYKDALENCIPYSQLDKKYGVGRGVCSNIANQKTYKYITENIEVTDNRYKLDMAKKEDYVAVKNLKDGGLYSNQEIATLLDTNKETVRNIVNDTWTFSKKDIEDYDSKFIGDGSGVIYYMDIKYDTIVDGVNFRNTVYCAKCDMYCQGCHNPQSWNIKNGKPISINNLAKLLLENGNDITFSGGECSLQAKAFTKLAQILKAEGRNIWLYSGHTYEELVSNTVTKKLLDLVDVLVDGKFVNSLRDTNLLFRGSSNQRIIDLNETRKVGDVVIWRR